MVGDNVGGGRGRNRLSPVDRERIVELRLNRFSVRKTADLVGCSASTVVKVWKRYLSERSALRVGELEELLEETMARMEKNAEDARVGYLRAVAADSVGESIRFLEAERKALTELSRLHAALLESRSVDRRSSSGVLEETLRSLVGGSGVGGSNVVEVVEG